MRPGALVVRVVVRPHEIVVELVALGEPEAGWVLLEGREAVRAIIVARHALQLRADPHVMLAVGLVHRVEQPGYPTDAGLDGGEPDLREPLQDTGGAEVRDRLDRRRQRVRDIVDDGAAIAARRPRIAAGRDVER